MQVPLSGVTLEFYKLHHNDETASNLKKKKKTPFFINHIIALLHLFIPLRFDCEQMQ